MSPRRHLAHLDANLCAFPNGHAVANFRLAVTSRVREGDAWKDGETSFFRVNVWRQQAENVVPELAPGSPEVVPVGVRG